jgi:hypothetical protein
MHGMRQTEKMKPENLINIVALVFSLLVGAGTVTTFIHSEFVPEDQYTKDQNEFMHRFDRIEDKIDKLNQIMIQKSK